MASTPSSTLRRARIGVALIILGSSAVAHGSGPDRPAAVPPESVPPAVPVPPRGSGPVLTIERAVEEALANNLEMIAKRYDVPIARAEKVTAKLRLNPVLSFGADHLDVLGTGYDNVNKAGPQEVFVRTDVWIMGGRKRMRRMKHADAAVTVAELDVENAARLLRLRVQLAYVEVQLAQANFELAQLNRVVFAEVVKLNETRVAAGDMAAVELRRARIAALHSENEVRRTRATVETSRNVLAEALGRPSGVAFAVTDEFRSAGLPPPPDTLEKIALEKRPDLEAIERDKLRAGLDVKRQIAEGIVDASVGVEVRRQQGLAGSGNSAGLFVSVPLPMFDRNQGEVERARRTRDGNDARLRAAARTIRTEVVNAHVEYSTAREMVGSFEAGLLDEATQVLETAGYSYRRGEASIIELLDAQRAFNDTRRTYNEARAALARSLYTIEAVSAKPLGK